MKQTTYLYGFLFLLIALNIWLSYYLYRTRQEKQHLYNRLLTCQSDADMESYIQENLKAISKIQFIAEGETVRDVTLYDAGGKEAGTLKDHLTGESKLIYFFSVQGCAGCYEPALYKLDSLVNRIGRDHLLVLAEFPNKRTMPANLLSQINRMWIFRMLILIC